MKRNIKVDAPCVSCGNKEKKHKAKGMCETCYFTDYSRKRRAKQKAQKKVMHTLQVDNAKP